MDISMKRILVAAVLAVAGVVVAAAPDPVAGSWQLNVGKSTFSTGRELKSETRVYRDTADGVSVQVTGKAANGKPVSQQSTFKYDGKSYPWVGAADYDALALKRINGSTVTATLSKNGKPVGTTVRTVSGHGKLLTLTTRFMGADGKRHSQTLIFDKQ